MLKLAPFRRNQEIIIISLFFIGSYLNIESKKRFFLQFLIDILSFDTHVFADPDPGSQNLADPTDPKHTTVPLMQK